MVTELSAKLSQIQWKLSFYVLDPMGRSSHTHCTNKTIGWANIYFRRYSWLSNYHLGRWWRQWPFLAARDNSPSRVWCTGELKDKFHWVHYFHWVSHFHLFLLASLLAPHIQLDCSCYISEAASVKGPAIPSTRAPIWFCSFSGNTTSFGLLLTQRWEEENLKRKRFKNVNCCRLHWFFWKGWRRREKQSDFSKSDGWWSVAPHDKYDDGRDGDVDTCEGILKASYNT